MIPCGHLAQLAEALRRWRSSDVDDARLTGLVNAVELLQKAGDNYSTAAKAIRPLILILAEPVPEDYRFAMQLIASDMDAWYRLTTSE